MSIYAWDQVFGGADVLWSEDGESINIGEDTILLNPSVEEGDTQIVTIDGEEYNFGSDPLLWQALWDWAVVKAENAEITADELESIRIRDAIAEFEIE